MQQSLRQETLSVIKQNISYYDEIAGLYDETLDSDSANWIIREKVASVFCGLVPSGLVLDFGGGTGKDLEWLAITGYQVLFCEPSVKMREIAIRCMQNKPQHFNISFLDNATSDFVSWQTNLPFSKKVDAVLANFAVINSIPDTELLFKNLSLVIKQGGHFLMLILKNDFKTRWKSNRLATLLSIFSGATVTTTIQFNKRKQTIYLHTANKIKKMAGPYFQYHGNLLFKEHGFELIHFTRK